MSTLDDKASPGPGGPGRLAWLDALRGLGAMAVVAEHLLPWTMPALRPYWFNLGMYGVLVFFLVSGYIIPASLEGRGEVRGFWISRVFRLYPLYLAVSAGVLLLAFWIPVRPAVPRDLSGVAGHLTMLLDVVQVGGLVDTMWTLSYEMVFYLLVTALFTVGRHRHSGLWAILFGAAAVAAGLVWARPLLSGGRLAVVSAVVFLAGVGALLAGRCRRTAAVTLGALALVLLLGASRVPWFGAAILAVMFAGTAIHRWERGQGPLWPVAVTGLLVAVAPVWAITAGWWWVQPDVWLTTLVLAGLTFAGGLALRGRRLPGALVRLGLISYSVYLVHHPLLKVVIAVTGDSRAAPFPVQLGLSALCVALVLGLSALTYRYIEEPGRRLGRRLARGAGSARREGLPRAQRLAA